MKKLMMFLSLAAALPLMANTQKVGDYTWTFTVSNGKATITSGSSTSPAISPNPTGEVAIPATLGGCTVVAVGNGAFYGTDLTGISDWAGVTSIGDRAFSGCGSLKAVTIPDAVTSVGIHAFYNCGNLTRLVVGDGVTAIPGYFAASCSRLSALKLGSRVTSIGNYAFAVNSRLVSVTIPSSVESIGDNAFRGCGCLKRANIAENLAGSVTKAKVFASCANDFEIAWYYYEGSETANNYTWNFRVYLDETLDVTSASRPTVETVEYASLPIPETLGGRTVTGIGAFAFQDEEMLGSIFMPTSITTIGECAFAGCTSLLLASVYNGVVALTTIGDFAFAGCTRLLPPTLGYALTTIGAGAFQNCSTNLYRMDIPDSVTSIGERAFAGCAALGSISLPISLRGMIDEDDVFEGCPKSLKPWYRGTAVAGARTWCYCVTADGSECKVYNYGYMAIDPAPEAGSTLVVPGTLGGFTVTGIDSYAFLKGKMKEVTLPDSVTSVGATAFNQCDMLELFTVASGNPSYKSVNGFLLSKDGKTLVRVPNGLTSVAIPNSVVSIGYGALEYCNKLTHVTIPNSVTNIGESAFAYCTNMTSVTIPNSVTTIGNYAFDICSGLTSVTIPNGVKSIGVSTFDGCSGLMRVTIPDSVTSIGGSAFSGCSGLTSVTIPNGVTNIDNNAFSYCRGLTRVTIPDSVTSIGGAAFYYCTNLTSVTIPNGVTTIGESAFSRCSGLTSVTIPNSVTNIENYAFAYCGSLTSALLPQRFEGNLDETVFRGCPESLVITYLPTYIIRFHRYDASDERIEDYEFDYGVSTALPKLSALSWARRGFTFKGWATSQANADAGKVWKTDGAVVATATAAGKTLNVWAVWALKSDSYAIKFIRNDGAGTWRTVGFTYGTKTRIPSLANGLGWARRGYNFKGWALTTADAAAGKVWKADWAYVATAAEKGTMLTVYAVWELKPGYYQIRYNKNDGTTKWRAMGFQYGVSTKLSTVKALGWSVSGKQFKGWATSKANADAGKVWKTDGAAIATAAAEGKTLSIYAIWR